MVRVIGQKILGVRDFQIHYSSFLLSGIDLGTFKLKVKFSNDFSLDPKMLKNLFLLLLHRI